VPATRLIPPHGLGLPRRVAEAAVKYYGNRCCNGCVVDPVTHDESFCLLVEGLYVLHLARFRRSMIGLAY
jgi:hypothetical protein